MEQPGHVLGLEYKQAICILLVLPFFTGVVGCTGYREVDGQWSYVSWWVCEARKIAPDLNREMLHLLVMGNVLSWVTARVYPG